MLAYLMILNLSLRELDKDIGINLKVVVGDIDGRALNVVDSEFI